MEERRVLAIDPGTGKCGLALVHRDSGGALNLLSRRIVPTDDLAATVVELHASEAFPVIVIGSGTNSRPVVHIVREALPGVGVLLVNEKETTLQARERYWEYHRRRGWRRLLPASMQVPPEPYDDFAALVLAERVLIV